MYFLSQTILLREETLNKLELIQEFKEKCQLTKQESSEVVEMFFSEMVNAFVKGERVDYPAN